MNASEIDETIERLRKVRPTFTIDVGEAFMGRVTCTSGEFRDALIELLIKARSNAWLNKSAKDDLAELSDDKLAEIGLIRLPVDADGEAILIGDQLDGVSEGVSVIARDLKYSGWLGWTVGDSGTRGMPEHGMYRPYLLRHHRTTVNEVLDELEGMCRTDNYEAAVERCADLARTLRELLEEGEA